MLTNCAPSPLPNQGLILAGATSSNQHSPWHTADAQQTFARWMDGRILCGLSLFSIPFALAFSSPARSPCPPQALLLQNGWSAYVTPPHWFLTAPSVQAVLPMQSHTGC